MPSAIDSGLLAPTSSSPGLTVNSPYWAQRPSGLKVNQCPILPALERVMLGSEDVVDCGSLPAHATTLMLQGAQRCVLDAGRQKKAFRVLYHPGSYDTVESAALAARGGEARLVYLQRTSTPVAAWTMRAVLKIDACEELRVREPCTFDHGDLCLDCIGVGIAEEPCQQMETF